MGVLRPAAALAAGLDAAPTLRAGADLRDGATSLIPAAARPEIPALAGRPVIDRPVTVGGMTWHLLTGYADRGGGTPWEAWLALAVGLLLAALVLGLVETVVRAQRQALQSAEARAREVALIAELGPVLQDSLDLGDLLPAVLVRLADEVYADRLGVLVAGDHGELVELFAIGAPLPDAPATIAQLRPAPEVIVAGEIADFPLQRAGHTIGALRLRTYQDLEPASLQALRAAIELVAASVANALLFQREQDTVVRLRDVDQLKTAFLGTASHELRTPVTAIRGFAELLVRKWDDLTDDQRLDFVRRIARNATSLSTLVGDLLDFARIERGEVRLAPQVLDVGALVALLVDELATVYGEHRFEVDSEAGIMATADADAVERIVSNLVANAAKFAPPASMVRVAVHQVGHRVELLVDDEGPGVPESERQRIFSRFYRGEGEAVVRTRGVGIGLSVVHDLTTRMGGTVTVSDAPSGGARFRVELPTAEATGAGAALADATPGERR
jgi:K+-sensing histidine kinase KdpD